MSGVKQLLEQLVPLLEHIIDERVDQRLAARDHENRAAQLISVREAARLLSMSERFVRDAIRDGRLAHVRVGRAVRVRAEDVATFAARRSRSSSLAPAEWAASVKLGGRR